MAVYSSNLVIKTGTTFEQVFTLEDGVSNSPINLTNFGVSAQMRKHRGAQGPTGITTFTCSIYDAVGGKIQIGLSTTHSITPLVLVVITSYTCLPGLRAAVCVVDRPICIFPPVASYIEHVNVVIPVGP